MPNPAVKGQRTFKRSRNGQIITVTIGKRGETPAGDNADAAPGKTDPASIPLNSHMFTGEMTSVGIKDHVMTATKKSPCAGCVGLTLRSMCGTMKKCPTSYG